MRRTVALPGYLWSIAALLVLVVLFYRDCTPRSPNDGSHWALARALAYDHTTTVDAQYSYTAGVDVSYCRGHYYSDRAPGTGLLGALFLYLRLPLGAVPALGALVAVLCSGLIVRRWCGLWPSLLTAAAVAFATLIWRYSHQFFSHAPAAGHVMAATYLALVAADRPRPERWRVLLCGWIVGYAMLVEYQLLLLTPLLGGYVLVRRWRRDRGAAWRVLWPGLVTWALAAGLLALYQYVSFGSPWHTSYAYRLGWHEGRAFEGDILTGLRGLLAGMDTHPPGLLTLSPVLWLALWGAFLMRGHRRWPEIACCLGVFVAVLLVLAHHPSWNGATTQDTRYLVCIVGLAMLPLGLWIERYLLVPREAWARLCYEGLFYTLLLVSIGLNCHGLFYKYTFTTGLPGFPALVSFDPGELLFGVVAGMPFDRIFWLFLAFGAGAMLAHVLWAAVRRARTGRSASPQDSSADD